MDITGVSTALANVNLESKIGVAVLDEAMEVNEAAGAGLIKMMEASAMEQSVNPYLGAGFDIKV